jgi:hypothetical protein
MAKRKLTPDERERFRRERIESGRRLAEQREQLERAVAALPADQRPDLPPYPVVPPDREPTREERRQQRARMEANSRWLRSLAEEAQAKLDAAEGV